MGVMAMRKRGTRGRRKGFILAEIVLGILILSGVLVAMSRFFASSLLLTLKAQDMSNAALDSYSQTRWVLFEPNLSREKLNELDLPDGVRISPDVSANGLKIELKIGGAKKAEIGLAAYYVGGDDHPLRVYRGDG